MSRCCYHAVIVGFLSLATGVPIVSAQSRAVAVPAWALSALHRSPSGSRVAPASWLARSVLRADFDGDRQLDVALLVQERGSSKRGIAIVHRSTKAVFIVGAGVALSNGGDNFDWLDFWRVTNGPAEQGATDEGPPRMRGAALVVGKDGSASALVYWTGTKYAWYQQGN